MAIAVISIFAFPTLANGKRPAKVFVLSTLHNFHSGNEYYSFETLSKIVKSLRPDIICVELSKADLDSRRTQKIKQEYQLSIFPLADKYNYSLVPLEPSEPKFSELVDLVRRSETELKSNSPEKAEAFSEYSDSLYDYLFSSWNSPYSVNSRQTDALFEVKHRFQDKLFGPLQAQGWEGWNQHFMEVIRNSAAENPGTRIVVLVGVEHAYWIRNQLRSESGTRLIESDRALTK